MGGREECGWEGGVWVGVRVRGRVECGCEGMRLLLQLCIEVLNEKTIGDETDTSF